MLRKLLIAVLILLSSACPVYADGGATGIPPIKMTAASTHTL